MTTPQTLTPSQQRRLVGAYGVVGGAAALAHSHELHGYSAGAMRSANLHRQLADEQVQQGINAPTDELERTYRRIAHTRRQTGYRRLADAHEAKMSARRWGRGGKIAVGTGAVVALAPSRKKRVKKADTATKPRYVPTPEQRAAQEARRAAQQAQRTERVTQAAKPVAAALPKRTLAQHIRHIPRTWPISGAGLAVAAGGVHHLRHQQQRQGAGDRSRGAAVGGAAGAGGALTTYHMGGKATKIAIQRHRNAHWDPKVHNPIWAEHQRSHGIGGKTGRTINDLPFNHRVNFYEKYPTSLPGGRAQRLLAIKNRRSVGVASVAAGAVGGAVAGQRRKQQPLAKSLKVRVRPGLFVGNKSRTAMTAGLAAGATGSVVHHRARNSRTRHAGAMVSAGIGGAGAGQAIYQAPAVFHQNFVRGRNIPEHMRVHGMTNSPIPQSALEGEDKGKRRAFEKERREWKAKTREAGKSRAEGYRSYPMHWPHARAERIQAYTHGGRSGQVLGATAMGLGAAAAMAEEHKAHQQSLAKALTPRRAAGLVQRNWSDAVLPAGVGAGALGVTSRHRDDRGPRNTAGALAGAGAGEGVWRATGLSLRNRGRKLERVIPKGMSRNQYRKITEQHRHKYGVNSKDRTTVNPGFTRNYPKELPAWPYKRAVGHMSGRRGMVLEGGTVATGAVLGARALRRQHEQPRSRVGKRMVDEPRAPRSRVGKRLVDEQNRRSPIRAAEFATGSAAVALGGPRLRMVGPGMMRGAKAALKGGHHTTGQTLIAAEAARRAWLTGTDPILRKLPAALRTPTVLAAGGGALLAHSIPVNRKTYQPVVMA